MVPHDAHEAVLTPSDSVRVVQNQDGAVLLDIRQGLCVSLNTLGIRAWNMLKQRLSTEQIAASLAAEFRAIPQNQIEDRVRKVIETLVQNGLLVSEGQGLKASQIARVLCWLLAPRSSSSLDQGAGNSRFLTLKALLGLFMFDCFGLDDRYPDIQQLVQSWKVTAGSPDPDIVDRVCQAVDYAGVWYPKRVFCLQRSTVTTCLLRSYGVPAQMVIAAQAIPFKAHAWVEISGKVIHERRPVSNYLIWGRC